MLSLVTRLSVAVPHLVHRRMTAALGGSALANLVVLSVRAADDGIAPRGAGGGSRRTAD